MDALDILRQDAQTLSPTDALTPLTDRAAEIVLGALEGDPSPCDATLWRTTIATLRDRPSIDVTSDRVLLGREWVARVRDGRPLTPIEDILGHDRDDFIIAMAFLQAMSEAALARLRADAARGWAVSYP